MPRPHHQPRPTKLHDKGRPISMQKANTTEKVEESTELDQEFAVRQFQLELCWCIQQLERNLTNKRGSERQIQDTWKTLQVLKNNNQSTIRKRQLMRNYFGDYRAKMQAEEKKLVKMASKMKICDKPDKPKATFLRKSVFQTTGDSSFRFNFNLTPEETDNGNAKTINSDTGTANTHSQIVSNIPSDSGDSTTKEDTKTEVNTFKFKFSDSNFRFNFNVGKQ